MRLLIVILLFLAASCTKAQMGILGVVTTPAAPTGTTFYTSDYLVSDADLSMHSTTYGTDNTAAMQAILDNGGNPAAPITIYVNGKYSATQLKVKGHTTIICTEGNGFIQRPSVAKSLVVNYNRTTMTAPTVTDTDITIQGGIWNGSGHSASGSENRAYHGAEGWQTVFNFVGVNTLTIQNATFRNGRTFLGYLRNVNGATVANNRFEQSPNYAYNASDVSQYLTHDGLKMGWGCYNITGTGNVFQDIKDDALSICPNDAFDPTLGVSETRNDLYFHDPYGGYGRCENISFTTTTFTNCYHGARILTKSHGVHNITIDGLSGDVVDFLLCLDDLYGGYLYTDGTTTPSNGTITLSNVTVTISGSVPYYPYQNTGVNINVPVSVLNLTNWNITNSTGGRKVLRTDIGASFGTLNINAVSVGGVLVQEGSTHFEVDVSVTTEAGNYWL